MRCHAILLVPVGPFRMGSEKKDDPQSFENEQPLQVVKLPDYAISRYPITQAQYEEFVDAGGYNERTFWDQADQAGNWLNGALQRQLG